MCERTRFAEETAPLRVFRRKTTPAPWIVWVDTETLGIQNPEIVEVYAEITDFYGEPLPNVQGSATLFHCARSNKRADGELFVGFAEKVDLPWAPRFFAMSRPAAPRGWTTEVRAALRVNKVLERAHKAPSSEYWQASAEELAKAFSAEVFQAQAQVRLAFLEWLSIASDLARAEGRDLLIGGWNTPFDRRALQFSSIWTEADISCGQRRAQVLSRARRTFEYLWESREEPEEPEDLDIADSQEDLDTFIGFPAQQFVEAYLAVPFEKNPMAHRSYETLDVRLLLAWYNWSVTGQAELRSLGDTFLQLGLEASPLNLEEIVTTPRQMRVPPQAIFYKGTEEAEELFRFLPQRLSCIRTSVQKVSLEVSPHSAAGDVFRTISIYRQLLKNFPTVVDKSGNR